MRIITLIAEILKQFSPDSVMVISTFDNQDHVTVYTYGGTRLWNAPFHAKILSWRIVGDAVFNFSKDRNGTKTYITCINRFTGALNLAKTINGA